MDTLTLERTWKKTIYFSVSKTQPTKANEVKGHLGKTTIGSASSNFTSFCTFHTTI